MLHLMVGLPCAGKTTLARKLEAELKALRLTPDEWQLRLFGDDLDDDQHDWRHSTLESLMWDLAEKAMSHGLPVILDYGFWAKEERDDYRAKAAALGHTTTIHFLDTKPEVLLERLKERNKCAGLDVFTIPRAALVEWIDKFQAPDADELSQNPPELS